MDEGGIEPIKNARRGYIPALSLYRHLLCAAQIIFSVTKKLPSKKSIINKILFLHESRITNPKISLA